MQLFNGTKKRKSESPDLFGFPQGGEWDDAQLILDATAAIEFVLAGKSKITLKSEKTGKHYTYKINKGDGEVWFVSRLTANNDYLYLGTIFPEGFTNTRKTSSYAHYSESFEGFKWFWRRLSEDKKIPERIKLFHAGRCGMCGLELTDPVSIKEGYGPDCRKKRLRAKALRDKTQA